MTGTATVETFQWHWKAVTPPNQVIKLSSPYNSKSRAESGPISPGESKSSEIPPASEARKEGSEGVGGFFQQTLSHLATCSFTDPLWAWKTQGVKTNLHVSIYSARQVSKPGWNSSTQKGCKFTCSLFLALLGTYWTSGILAHSWPNLGNCSSSENLYLFLPSLVKRSNLHLDMSVLDFEIYFLQLIILILTSLQNNYFF